MKADKFEDAATYSPYGWIAGEERAEGRLAVPLQRRDGSTNDQSTPWGAAATGQPAAPGEQDTHERLRRVGSGQAGLWESFQTLTQSREDHARQAADLLERETWALTGILAASGAIWPHLASPTLRFALESGGDAGACHAELGLFTHLVALDVPSAAEQTLISASAPCFARVVPSQERQAAGRDGPLACSYGPMPVTEAVATIGFAKIVDEIEVAARSAGQVLLRDAEAQAERQKSVLRVERMFGWAPDPPCEAAAPPVGSRVATFLVKEAGRHWLLQISAAFGAVAALSGLLLCPYYAVLALLLLGIVVVFWKLALRPGL